MITVTSFDILRISKRAKLDPKEFARIVPCTLFNKDERSILWFSDCDFPDGYILIIKSHPCFFLDINNRCMIHEYAPRSCRRYPFDLEGNRKVRFCSWVSNFLFSLEGPQIDSEICKKEISGYWGIISEWNKSPGKIDDCLDFLMERSLNHDK
jgi:Fe-S-cluster containining protein